MTNEEMTQHIMRLFPEGAPEPSQQGSPYIFMLIDGLQKAQKQENEALMDLVSRLQTVLLKPIPPETRAENPQDKPGTPQHSAIARCLQDAIDQSKDNCANIGDILNRLEL